MRIVVLDGFTLNPGDLDWSALASLGNCTIHARTPPEETVARARGAACVLTNKVVLSRAVIAQLPDLRYIGVLATGYNVVDIAAARERGIVVANVPAYSTESVAQMVFAHALNLAQHVDHHATAVRDGRWTASPDFAFWDFPLIELQGLCMGLVGYGRIGRAVARLALAFGMRVLVYSGSPRDPEDSRIRMAADLDDVFREADVLSLHCPLTPQTAGLVNAARLAMMKPSGLLINTGRGPLVDEAALAAALNEGRLAGAGLDVLSAEPPPADNPLLRARNCFITPHIAWATRAARARLMRAVTDNLRAFLAGRPQNVVS